MHFPKGVLFDLDGTLVHTAPDFVIAANALRHDHGRAPLAAELIEPVVSNGAAAVTQVALELSDQSDSRFEQWRQELLAHYDKALGSAAVIYPGLDAALTQLEQAGIGWGVVTNKPDRFAEKLLQQLGLRERCQSLICPEHVSIAKPDPEGLHLAATALQLPTAEILYVGDHQRDIEAAKRAGCPSVAVGYGYIAAADEWQHWGADYLVDTPEALAEQLLLLLGAGRSL